ncbi:protein kinase domain-containing protein [Krasilnikovia sp. M28-CT-15]|uniref:serine/threonine-protein kinase n=1 Tax=Krasilnikovia sp. M28-CT-15 TaxID=3373540 RepID=UPI003876B447
MTQIPTWSGGDTTPTSGRAAPGTLIGGRYTLRAAVGHGGMGTVWRAADTLLRRDVAIKEVVLPPGLAPSDRDSMFERTMREARAAAALQHPAVVQVYDVVHENDRPWIVMELLDARSLADMVIEDGPVAPRVVAKIGIALLGALEVAHAHGVLHRDVKPANVLICSDGRCVLTDFGVARMPTDVQLTTPGMVLGSPHFISPERAMGQDFGPPSDLFSLGVTLYTAVEGRPPFDKGDPIETMHAVVEDPPAPTQRSGSLTPVLMGLLEKDPARRFDVQTARTMLRQQLAGPLASKSPPHLMTDPYSVVPAQRPDPAATQAVPPPQPTGQIGGRAMLAPGESLTGHLAKLRQGGRRRAPESPATPASGPPTGAFPAPPPARDGDRTSVLPPNGNRAGQLPPDGDRTGLLPPAGDSERTSMLPPGGSAADPTSLIPPRRPWDGARAAREPLPGGTVVMSPGAKRRAALATATRTVRAGSQRVVTTVRGWPRNTQLAAAGGLTLVLVLAVVLMFSGGKDPQPRAQQQASVQPAPAAFETQEHHAKGVTVKVPKAWERSASGVWVDYVDPQDDTRKVRILVEKGDAEPRRFAEKIAEHTLEKSKNCPKPYSRVSVSDVQVSGQNGAQLEYTCGSGAEMRHGVWREITRDGKMYSFYLTTTDARFAESMPIFEEMARTFAFENA